MGERRYNALSIRARSRAKKDSWGLSKGGTYHKAIMEKKIEDNRSLDVVSIAKFGS